MHGEWNVRKVAPTRTLEWDKRLRVLRLDLLLPVLLYRLILLLLQLVFQVGNRRPVEGTVGNAAILKSAAIEAWAVVVIALSDDLATTNDDTAMTVV